MMSNFIENINECIQACKTKRKEHSVSLAEVICIFKGIENIDSNNLESFFNRFGRNFNQEARDNLNIFLSMNNSLDAEKLRDKNVRLKESEPDSYVSMGNIRFTKDQFELVKVNKNKILEHFDNSSLLHSYIDFNCKDSPSFKIKKLLKELSEKPLDSLTKVELIYILNIVKDKEIKGVFWAPSSYAYLPNFLEQSSYSSLLISLNSNYKADLSFKVAIFSVVSSVVMSVFSIWATINPDTFRLFFSVFWDFIFIFFRILFFKF